MKLFGADKNPGAHAWEGDLILQEEAPFLVQEAYKALRTNVIFSLPGSGCKCIGVTSAQRGEGKSTSTINLAVSFGQIRKKVLVIDCDMRLPTVASKLRAKAQPGLSNLLIGDCTLEEAIQEREEQQISILPAGVLPPDPTGLLESAQMQQLIQRLRADYDYIFIDLPPVTAVADAVILSKCIDGFLMVVRHGKTERRDIAQTLGQLRFVNAHIIGFVYTGMKMGGRKYYRSKGSYYRKEKA